MASTGWLPFGTLTQVNTYSPHSPGTQKTWTSLSNGLSGAGTYTYANVEGDPEETTYSLVYSAMVHGLTATDEITGISFRYYCQKGSGSGNQGTFVEWRLQIALSGVLSGTNKASNTSISTTATLLTDGSAVDMWGLSSLHGDDLDDLSFVLQFYNDDGFDDTDGRVYYAEVQFEYTPGAGGGGSKDKGMFALAA